MSKHTPSKLKLTLQSFEETLRATKATNFFTTWRSSKREASKNLVKFLTGRKHAPSKDFFMVQQFFTDRNINSESDLKSCFSLAVDSSLSENHTSNTRGLSISESQEEVESIVCSTLGLQVSCTCMQNVTLIYTR